MNHRHPAHIRGAAWFCAVVTMVSLFVGCKKAEPEPEPTRPALTYAEGVTVVNDKDEFQEALNEAYKNAREGNIALEYKNSATSSDGTTFSCYIANSVSNKYDMYINIYSDLELTDELYLSGLIRPGTAFEEIELNHPLEKGTHTVYVVYTQVEEDLATIHAQVIVTCQFVVQ